MNIVLDSSAAIAYLDAEPGGDQVRDMLQSDEHALYMHAINLCELYYHSLRLRGHETALGLVHALQDAGVTARTDMDEPFWLSVGARKAVGRIALADCFAVALAQRLDATLITCDRHEFEPLAERNLIPIQFIR